MTTFSPSPSRSRSDIPWRDSRRTDKRWRRRREGKQWQSARLVSLDTCDDFRWILHSSIHRNDRWKSLDGRTDSPLHLIEKDKINNNLPLISHLHSRMNFTGVDIIHRFIAPVHDRFDIVILFFSIKTAIRLIFSQSTQDYHTHDVIADRSRLLEIIYHSHLPFSSFSHDLSNELPFMRAIRLCFALCRQPAR